MMQNTIKMCGFWLGRGVSGYLMRNLLNVTGFFLIFSHFSQFLAKMAVLKMSLKLKCQLTEKYHKNVRNLISSRGLWASNEEPLAKYWIFLIFSHFSQFLAKNGCFLEWFWSEECSKLQNTIKMCGFDYVEGFCELLMKNLFHDTGFFLIFSHFSQLLAKNGCFGGRPWSHEWSMFECVIAIYQFLLKKWVSQRFVMRFWGRMRVDSFVVLKNWDPPIGPTPPSEIWLGFFQFLTSGAHITIFHHRIG